MLTVRGAPSELSNASREPLTVRLPPPWHSWSALDAVAGSPSPGFDPGLAVGSDTSDRAGGDHGPAHPGPTETFHVPPPAGLIRTAPPPATESPDTVKADPEVTMTVLPSFSVSATRTWVPSWAGLSPASDDPL